MKLNIAGVLVDDISKQEALGQIDRAIELNKQTYVVTPYSEMIVMAQSDENYRKALNGAFLALPDGVGIIFAAKYLGFKIKERITGRLFVYDLARLASEKNYSLALVGGLRGVAGQAADVLKKIYPNLRVKLALSDKPFNDQIIQEINNSNSDILLIAYSPPKQELWLYENYQKFNSKVAIGLGGTFDYLAGKRLVPPKFMHYIGLEWLWRLITQPWRIKRIWNAVPVFIWKVYKFKKYGRS